MAIWVLKDGQREGPYDEQDVRELVYEGTYAGSDPAIEDGEIDWTSVDEILARQPVVTGEGMPEEAYDPSLVDHPVDYQSAPVEMVPAEAPPMPAAEVVPQPAPVTVVDVQMPFLSMLVLALKFVAAMAIVLTLAGLAGVMFLLALVMVAALAGLR